MQFKKAVEDYIKAFEQVLSVYRSNGDALSGPMLWRGVGNAGLLVQQMFRGDFGRELNLSAHPHFDANQLEPAPGDENIKNEKSKGEYRRYYDQLQTSKPILAGAEQQYQSAIEIYRAQIQAFGRNLPVNLQ